MMTGRDCLAPSALEVVAGTLAAVIAPPPKLPLRDAWHDAPIVRDVDLLQRECDALSHHIAAADRASAGLAAARAVIDDAGGRPGCLIISVPPDLGRRLRAEAARMNEDPAALATEILALVFEPGSASLLDAVLDRPRES